MVKNIPRVNFRMMAPADHDRLRYISDAVWGPGYFDPPLFKSRFSDPMIEVIEHKHEVIGFVLSGFLKPESFDITIGPKPFPRRDEIKEMTARGKLGVVKTLLIDPVHQESGFGTLLFEEASHQLMSRGAESVVVSVPGLKEMPGPEVRAQNILNRYGYEPLHKDEAFWDESCDRQDYACIFRTGGHCRCSVLFYIKEGGQK